MLVRDPFLLSPAKPKMKMKPLKTKRCGVCKECTSGVQCGTCGFCKSGKPELLNRCPAKLCKSRVQVQPRGPRCRNPVKEKKPGRCGECAGCLAEECEDCDNCIKKSEGEILRSNQICAKKKCLTLEAMKAAAPKEKKPKMKRTRCGKCRGCKMAEGCGKCSHCLKVSVKLCTERRCQDPILSEVKPREPKQPKPPKQQVVKEKKVPTLSKGRRCQECEGCNANPCGLCNACQKTPELCKARECTNRITRGAGAPKEKPIYHVNAKGRGNNPRRFKRCGQCAGCKMENCGECQSCRHNKEFADQMLAPATCLQIVCDDPIDLFGTGHKQLSEQEDGTCPTKVILGKLYDFRCYFCKVLPRVGSANRSELYRHYSLMHYTAELSCEFGRLARCPICSKEVKGGSYISHMGQVHDEVHKYLPEAAKIPRKVQGTGGGGRGQRRGAVFVRKRFVDYIFPDIPDGFDPDGEERVVDPLLPEPEPIIIDGFCIEQDVDEDEALVVSREEPVKLPDYRSGARCIICKSVFSETREAVLHIHIIHNIKGGSHNIMLDADRLLKAGYLALCYGETVTSITEKGREKAVTRKHSAFRSLPPKGWVKLVGTGLPNDTKLPMGPLVTYEHKPEKQEEQEKEKVELEKVQVMDIEEKQAEVVASVPVPIKEAPSNIVCNPNDTSVLVP